MTAKSITVQGTKISIISNNQAHYICLTDMVKGIKGGEQLIKNWMQNKNTLEFLGVWEELNNPNFNLVEFHRIRNDAGANKFLMSAKQWISKTGAIGIEAKTGRYTGGTFAHIDIALEFAAWLSPAFRLYIIKEFQRFKEEESRHQNLDWQVKRTLAKINYRIHTDAVKKKLIPPQITKKEAGMIYASEAEVINKAGLGITSKEWRSANPNQEGNIRDHISVEQLLVLANIETINAMLIAQGMTQQDRLLELNKQARSMFKSITASPATKELKPPPLLLNTFTDKEPEK